MRLAVLSNVTAVWRVTAPVLAALLLLVAAPASAQTDKPNILVIFGDDIGMWNISAYHQGMMGGRTPNIDRIAAEGAMFTDYYAQQSCTAGRSAFITGQHPFRTGLLTVGLPGSPLGLQAEDPTLADLLKNHGYATAQHGKNHLGDRNEFLPTMHGFDEFFGNLYHLNAEEEPELHDYPPAEDFPDFKKNFGPRGVIHSYADGRIEDTGPLTKKRMETCDEGEFLPAAVNFIEAANKDDTPFFVWFNATHMHFRTHTKPSSLGQAGVAQSFYHDTMIDHDNAVGEIVDLLDELKIADNTILLYSTDNGPHRNSWPDAGMTKFRSEKNTGWEGAYRVPQFVRWPGKVKAGSISNEIMSHLDWTPTLLAAAGNPDVKQKLLKGYKANGRKYKNHLDGYNFLPHLTGKEEKGPRVEFFYFSDDGDLLALRHNNWKVHFMVQDQPGLLAIWQHEFRGLRMPYFFNLRTDPYEFAHTTSNTYWDWFIDHAFILYPMGSVVGPFLKTFDEFPPVQKPASFTVGDAFKTIQAVPNQ